jgi:hypothetical protein
MILSTSLNAEWNWQDINERNWAEYYNLFRVLLQETQ